MTDTNMADNCFSISAVCYLLLFYYKGEKKRVKGGCMHRPRECCRAAAAP
jgi:hypothetical protein